MYLNWVFETVCSLSATSLVVAVATLLVAVVYNTLQVRGLPPGPTGVPILGYWPFVSYKDHLQFNKLTKKYGEVFSFWCTGTLYVNLGSHRMAREAFIVKSDCFADRPKHYRLLTDLFSGGIGFLNGEEWKVPRKFFVNYMRDRGSGSILNLPSLLYESVNTMVDALREKAGEQVDIMEPISGYCNIILRHFLFSENGPVSHKDVTQIGYFSGIILNWLSAPNFLPSGNIAKYLIFPFMEKYRVCKAYMEEALKYVNNLVEEHKATYDEENIRDIIDAYIQERNLGKSKGDPAAKYLTDSALVATIVGLIGDGSQSIAVFLGKFVLILLDYPEEQEKIYRELVEVVGVDRQTTIEDKNRLPYTNAFIQEALRTKIRFYPYFTKQVCTKETTLNGYRIPEGAITVMDFHSINNDPEVYEDPEKFDPSRFMAKDGKQRPDLPNAFGMGKRSCIGEGFTMLQVFVFLTNIIKNFHISVANGVNLNVTEVMESGKLEVILRPRCHK